MCGEECRIGSFDAGVGLVLLVVPSCSLPVTILVGYVGHVVSAKSLKNADTRHVGDTSATCRADMSATCGLSRPFLTRHRRQHVGMLATCPRHVQSQQREAILTAPTPDNYVDKEWTSILCLLFCICCQSEVGGGENLSAIFEFIVGTMFCKASHE